jgi:hypothetical protein
MIEMLQKEQIAHCSNCNYWEYIGRARGICKGNFIITDPVAKVITKKDFFCKEFVLQYSKVDK